MIIYRLLDIIQNLSYFPLSKRTMNGLQGILARCSLRVVGIVRETTRQVEPMQQDVRIWSNREGDRVKEDAV